MDRFKYRLWDKESKNMLYDNNVVKLNDYYSINFRGEVVSHRGLSGGPGCKERFVIMRCTAFKDINGELLFENDIVRDKWNRIFYIKFSEYFQQGRLYKSTDDERDGVSIFDCIHNNIELEKIGDICNNPELLEVYHEN